MGAEKLARDGGTPVRSSFPPFEKGVDWLGDEERGAALAVLDSRSLFRYYGPDLQGAVAAFEDETTRHLGCAHAVAVSSGTAALRTALAALGVGAGDEVIVPSFTFIATVNAVVVAGAVPVFAEIDDTLNLDPADLDEKISPRTAAIIPVHLENVAADMDAILAVASRRSLPVLEDAAQAIGVRYHGRAVGTLGDIGAFSLQLSKNITSGEGGIVTTDDDDLYLRAARYQDQGGQFVTQHGGSRGDELGEPFIGENLRMTELAGAIARVQLGRLPDLIDRMRANARRILTELGDVEGLTARRVPDPEGAGWSSLTWFAPDATLAGQFVEALLYEGIPSAQMYEGLPVYSNPAILAKRTATGKGAPWNSEEHPCRVEYRMGMCPATEELGARSFSVGVGPAYTDADCDDVAEGIRKVAQALLGG